MHVQKIPFWFQHCISDKLLQRMEICKSPSNLIKYMDVFFILEEEHTVVLFLW